METFEWVVALLLGAALLALLARRVGAPYPTFLAIGGACLAFVPEVPRWTLDPHLALTLFVAPILVDAAYDASLRDLRDNWAPVASLVLAAVVATTAAVAVAARGLVPEMPWAVAIALGAVVAPPDAAAATAVVRQVALPHRLLKILEGESLLNDASALLIYRLAVLAAVAGSFSLGTVLPILALSLAGSIAAGIGLARLTQGLMNRIDDVPVAIVVQFALTFGIWIAAEAIGLSGILTLVAYAMTVARRGRSRIRARMRVPIFAFWETAVFILNALAFVLIGLQLRPIWERLGERRFDDLQIAVAILVVTIAARFAWVMLWNSAIRAWIARHGFHPVRPMAPPTAAGGVLISWAGMRGIVTLAAAFALPENLADGRPFPNRDLILLTAFVVVFGTLVIQGLTLKPLIRWLGLVDDDPVGREVREARVACYRAALGTLVGDESLPAKLLRKEYAAILEQNGDGSDDSPAVEPAAVGLRRRALEAARACAFELRASSQIGDDAFRQVEIELDWAELSAGGDRPA